MYSSDYGTMLNEYSKWSVTDWQDYTGMLAFLSLYRDAHDPTGDEVQLMPMPVFIEELQETGFAGMRTFLEDCNGCGLDMRDALSRTVSRCGYTMPTMQTMTLSHYGIPTMDEDEIEKPHNTGRSPMLDAASQEVHNL